MYTEIFKALSDPNRLQIFQMLSCCELCGHDILAQCEITQPTLSHHMKVLCGCGLVNARKTGKCVMYSLNAVTIKRFLTFFNGMVVKDCSCILGSICTCDDCAAHRKEVPAMACTNPHCKCEHCTCDPCTCTAENPCACCESCEVCAEQ